MIINVTEEQKKLIESQGYMVVEFKQWYRKIGEFLVDFAQKVIDERKVIILFIQEKMCRELERLRDLAKRISTELKQYVDMPKDIDFEERHKYPFVRSLGNEYRPNFSKKVVYHRCRDRC